jgi:hypothetical protein
MNRIPNGSINSTSKPNQSDPFRIPHPVFPTFIHMIDKQNMIREEEQAVLVGVVQKDQREPQVQEYLDELAFLAETAGAVTVKRFIQKLAHPDSRTFVGKGKLQEIKAFIALRGIDVLIFDDELSGAQIGNIQKEVGIKVIDRSDLILDIFARRAKTAQAKAQVELAQYQYILPRLRGMWKHLERLGGGIGTRGDRVRRRSKPTGGSCATRSHFCANAWRRSISRHSPNARNAASLSVSPS